ncbi:MAG TPA: hypothetical protein VKV17_09765 [Bryobacteraceae bacterium]|nr:hypothetical protein [Bryobacteraceae bacterium]
MDEQKGTGKHPHKSTAEPEPHTKQAGAGGKTEEKSEASEQSSESSDLKNREYRDKQSNIHHHTHTYEEQHE